MFNILILHIKYENNVDFFGKKEDNINASTITENLEVLNADYDKSVGV